MINFASCSIPIYHKLFLKLDKTYFLFIFYKILIDSFILINIGDNNGKIKQRKNGRNFKL
jgi:hypothetical protein